MNIEDHVAVGNKVQEQKNYITWKGKTHLERNSEILHMYFLTLLGFEPTTFRCVLPTVYALPPKPQGQTGS